MNSVAHPCDRAEPFSVAVVDRVRAALAHRALTIDREIGLLLPCNVVVRADGPDVCLVQALDPQTMVEATVRSDLKPVADEAGTRLRKALAGLAA
ncbi:hypothetical protein GCM10009557_53510 [Virgisporangium ochraceum]|uniref:DUF302 domain-containing protein n=1 Tax=Virgisporangium ochraceum TaxID=65505 RepID=A0A8J4EEI5_9ACTN|nr:DUF302 domain-containing protein [Virgisporangium ochraceum]GIJ71668.1 hypothetical protein Voc01_065850 [Virgisporangium ochraceum]